MKYISILFLKYIIFKFYKTIITLMAVATLVDQDKKESVGDQEEEEGSAEAKVGGKPSGWTWN